MYMLVAILFGGFCWMIVVSLTNGIIDLAYWSTSWGTNLYGTERIEIIQSSALSSPMITDDETAVVSKTLEAGQSIIGLWNALARTLAAAFMYGMFWCMASAIYLLIRKDVDETETDEIFVSDERRTYDLPPLQSDENGIPQVQELVPVDENTKNDDPNDDPPTSADYDTIVN
jgi:predicted PurR-regulated permease PerM